MTNAYIRSMALAMIQSAEYPLRYWTSGQFPPPPREVVARIRNAWLSLGVLIDWLEEHCKGETE